MDQHLAALVAAAREAMVNAAKHAEVEEISVYAEVEDGTVSVFVRDRGVGFDPAAVGTDRRGLAESIRGRMDRHGGTATVRSQPGEGTEVELTVPVTARRPDPGSRDRASRPRERGCRYRQGSRRREGALVSHPVKVFLVDDHALFRTGVKAELAGLDDDRIEVVGEAGSVGEAVVRISSQPPDVVLLDVHMPDGGGRAVLEQVHATLPGCGVPGAARLRRRRGRDRRDPGRRPRATSPRRSPGGNSPTRWSGCRPATRCSRRGWPVSCWTRSPTGAVRRRSPTRNSTCCRRASARCSSCWPAATPTRRSPRSCSSRSRRSRPTCPACCARPRSPTGTSCPAGPRPAAGLSVRRAYLRPSLPRPMASSSMPRSVPAGSERAEAFQDRHLPAVDDLRPAEGLAGGADGVRDRGAVQDQPDQFGIDGVDLHPELVDPVLVGGNGNFLGGVAVASMAGSVMRRSVRRCTGRVLAVGCGAVRALVMMDPHSAPAPRTGHEKRPGSGGPRGVVVGGGFSPEQAPGSGTHKKTRPRRLMVGVGEAGHVSRSNTSTRGRHPRWPGTHDDGRWPEQFDRAGGPRGCGRTCRCLRVA